MVYRKGTTICAESFTDEDSGVTYTPYIDTQFGCVGYLAEHPDGRSEYIYLNASGGSDDGVPNVFVYIDNDLSSFVHAVHHYDLFQED